MNNKQAEHAPPAREISSTALWRNDSGFRLVAARRAYLAGENIMSAGMATALCARQQRKNRAACCLLGENVMPAILWRLLACPSARNRRATSAAWQRHRPGVTVARRRGRSIPGSSISACGDRHRYGRVCDSGMPKSIEERENSAVARGRIAAGHRRVGESARRPQVEKRHAA